ncbi:MAG TPA: dienelactone hydrolase family protein [Candidatus Dormibacteraeota bacterium]|nr:dienelactone hydrolase family protein [Candidatus Dormibacteraeota bacterium]
MCFDADAHPPIAPIEGGAVDGALDVLTADDGNRFSVYRAKAAEPSGAAIVVLPDTRGLYPYYEELALRFAENGIDAIAIDYFGRTAGLGERDADFDYMPHTGQTTWAGLSADITAAVSALREEPERVRSVFTIGFCFGGRTSFVAASLRLGLSGVIGFYGWPVGSSRNGTPAPADTAERFECPVLGLFGGADQGVTSDAVEAFERALGSAGVEHRIVTYEGAPHSFFDRKQEEFAVASTAAWDEVLRFIRAHTGD